MIFINSIKCPELILRGCSSPDKIQLICEPFNIHDIVVCRIKNEKQKITSDKHKRRRYHALGNGDPRLAAVAKGVQEGGIPCCASFLSGEGEGEYHVLVTKM